MIKKINLYLLKKITTILKDKFFWFLLIIIFIFHFIVGIYRVPTGSLIPTITPVEFIYVDHLAFGLRFPNKLLKIDKIPNKKPKRGDLVVFYFPKNEKIFYIKRVIGLPNDQITIFNGNLFINGEKIKRNLTNNIDCKKIKKISYQEIIDGKEYTICVNNFKDYETEQNLNFFVPPGQYFVLGDNRDDSFDSRYWGFVAEKSIIGKAKRILFSYDKENRIIRYNRIGEVL